MFPSHCASLVRIGATAALVMLPFAAIPAEGAQTAASQPMPTGVAERVDTAAADSRVAQRRAARVVKSRAELVDGIDEAGMSPYGRLARMVATGRLDAALERARDASGNPPVPKVTPPFMGADDGTTLPGGQADMSIAVDATGNNVVVVFNDGQGLALSPVSVSGFAWSSDGGATFTVGGMLPSPQQGTFGSTAYPQVFGNPDVKYVPGGSGCQFVAVSVMVRGIGGSGLAPNVAYAGTAQTLAIHRSVDCGHTWSGPFEVDAATNPTGALVGSSARDVADRPSIDVDPDAGRVLASWSNFTSTTVIGGGVEIRTAFSDNVMGGAPPTWSAGTVVNGASTDFDTGAMARFAGNGSANTYIAWARKSNHPAAATPYGGEACGNTIFARSTDNGATWSTPVKLHTGGICVGGDYWPMDQIPGNDLVHSHPAIAVDTSAGPASGNVYVVYTANDAKDGGDVHFVKSANGGTSFAAPVRLNARPGVDRSQWFPNATVAPTGRIYVIWYDQQFGQFVWNPRAKLDVGDLTETSMTYSDDAGATWTRPSPLTERPFQAGYGNDTSQPNFGERIGATASGDRLYAAWAGNPPSVGFADGQPTSASFTVPALVFRRTNTSGAALRLFQRLQVFEHGGNQNGYFDPGERVQLHPVFENFVTNATVGAGSYTNVTATLSSRTPGVTVPVAVQSYGTVAAGDSGYSPAPFIAQLPGNLVPGTRVDMAFTVTTAGGGTATLPFTFETGTRNWAPVDLFAQNFLVDGPLPAGWTTVHGGGATTVPWVTYSGFCGRRGLFHPNAIDGPDPTRLESALSPPIVIPANVAPNLVTLDFWMCYETEDDPDFNVLAYDGLMVRIVDETTGRVVRPVLPEAFAQEVAYDIDGNGQRGFGYAKHLPRNGNPAYFQGMPVWSGSSLGARFGEKLVHMVLPGMQGSTVRLSFDYAQDGSGTCTDAGHAGSPPGVCGVLVGEIRMQAVTYVEPLVDLEFTTATATPGTVLVGGNVTYQYGFRAATLPETAVYRYFWAGNVVFTDPLPAGTTFVSLNAPTGWTCTTPAVGANGTVSCSRLSMGPEETGAFTIVARASAGASCINTASVSTESPEKSTANNSGTTVACAITGTDLAATVTAPSDATAGGELDYTFGVANLGPNAAQAVSIAFAMPSGTTLQSFAQALGPAFACTVPPIGTTGTATCTIPALAGNLSAEFALKVKIDGALAGGTIEGTASVSTTTLEGSLANNVASVRTLLSSAMLVATVDGTGAGTVTSLPAGINCPGTCSGTFAWNSTVRLNAAAAAGSAFAGWSGPCTGTAACVVTMDKVQSVTATFVVDANSRVLAVTQTGSGTGRVDSVPSGISCGLACEASFAGGSTVTLTAATEVDAVFVGWTGACSGIGACTLTMNVPQTVGAEFAVAVAKLESSDFDADAHSDLVWRDANSGTTQLTLMDGLGIRAATTFQLGAQWAVTHAGDFDGDGKSDLVWHNESAAETSIWIMDGTQYVRGQSILAIPGWTVTHVADFDGDGKDDLLWRNAGTAEVAVWLMNGPAYVRGSIVLAEPLWSVSHVGDFNGDGKSDLVWRNATTGQVALWLMDGTAAIAGGIVLALPQWQVTGVGDFDGDGKSDLAWRNANTGETALWLMNGVSYASGTIVTVSLPWAVTHVADLDGDGRSDLVWRNGTTGATAVWLMHGLSRGKAAVSADAPDWLVRRTADLNGDGKADMVWRNRVNDFTGVWLMDGTTPIAVARPIVVPAEMTVQ